LRTQRAKSIQKGCALVFKSDREREPAIALSPAYEDEGYLCVDIWTPARGKLTVGVTELTPLILPPITLKQPKRPRKFKRPMPNLRCPGCTRLFPYEINKVWCSKQCYMRDYMRNYRKKEGV
jgi:hypothetical protein